MKQYARITSGIVISDNLAIRLVEIIEFWNVSSFSLSSKKLKLGVLQY